MRDGVATLRLKVPFTSKAEIELKKVGLELVVRVSEHKRNIMLPPSLGSYRPRKAKLDEGTLTITFEQGEGANGAPTHEGAEAPAPKAR